MKIDYSYGLLGYLLKYFGGIFFVALFSFILVIAYTLVTKNAFQELPFASIVMTIFCITMGPFSAKSAFYCTRYANSFTRKYIIRDNNLTISDKNGIIETYSFNEVEKIVYRRILKVFEIYFKNLYTFHKNIVSVYKCRTFSIKYNKNCI